MLLRNTIQMAYGIPGILSYFLVFYAMFRLRKILNRSFVIIYSIIAVTNMLTWANACVYLKLTVEPFFFFYYEWLQEHSVMAAIHSFLIPHFYYVQNICVFLLIFDRFATIFSIVKNTTWWTRFYIYIAAGIHIAALGIHLLARLPMVTRIIFDPITPKYNVFFDDAAQVKQIAANIQLVFGILVFLTCSILNILSFILLKKLKKTRKTMETSFLLISFCIFLTQLLNLALQRPIVGVLHAIFNAPRNDVVVYEIMSYTSDLFSIGPAIYTLVLPGPIRRFYLRKDNSILPVHNSQNTFLTNVKP